MNLLALPKVLIVVVIFASCNSCGNDNGVNVQHDDIPKTAPIAIAPPITTKSKAKLVVFNDVNDVREKISKIGIGSLGEWKSDDADGYMSVMPYYQFDEKNYLACYLESNSGDNIKILKLVLDINNGNKKPSLLEFRNKIAKIYDALELKPDSKLLNSAKAGKEVIIEKENRIESIKLQKSNIETWKFVIESK